MGDLIVDRNDDFGPGRTNGYRNWAKAVTGYSDYGYWIN
jgi:hypothetical protein